MISTWYMYLAKQNNVCFRNPTVPATKINRPKQFLGLLVYKIQNFQTVPDIISTPTLALCV